MFTSVQLRFSSFFLVIFTSESGNLLTYKKNNHFLSSLERPMKTSWRNTASRHRDNVHVYDKWPVWGYFRVDQPTSTCFKWHTSISVYLQRTSGFSNSHERRCSTRNLDNMHTIWGICLQLRRVVLHEVWSIFLKKMTTTGKISLRDITHKITFFQGLARFIYLKHLMSRTLDVNIAKLWNIWFWAFFANCPIKRRGRPAEIFTYLKTRIL